MNVSDLPIESLHFDPSNARKHSPRNIDTICASLKRYGQQKPIVVDADNIVIAGNGTLEAARKIGWKTIAAHRTHLRGAEALSYAIADNRTTDLSEWDKDVLESHLQGLAADDYNLDDLGFSNDELEDLDLDLKDLIPSELDESKEDEIPEVAENIHNVKLGDIYQLGEHRLMCGDSTCRETVDKLMDGNKADMVFTDPPYGMSYGGGRTKKFGMIDGDDQDPAKFYNVLDLANDVYLWGRVENWDSLPEKPRDVIVWKKNNFGLGRGYRGQYEVCFYFGDFSGSDSDVWEISKDTKYVHPTQKPIALCERAIKNSIPNKVLDLFLGSGSTLIACEKTNRKCYGMEIDPHYCSVIIERWQQYTGKEAVKLSSKDALCQQVDRVKN